MSHDTFLPPPVRLCQAFESDLGGGGETRRTFIKRTGGATVATFVAWNLSSANARASGDGADSGSVSKYLYCKDEPSTSAYSNAFPANLQGAIRQQQVLHTTDSRGEGVVWDLYHWVELHEYPKRKDSVPTPSHSMYGQATAHMVVTRSYWTYKQETTWDPYFGSQTITVKDQWVTVTEVHLMAGGSTEADDDSEVFTNGDLIIDYSDMQVASNNNASHKIVYSGTTMGWALVSLSTDDFDLRSDAVVVVRSYVASEEWNYNGNVSAEIGDVGIGGGGGYSQVLGTNQEPPASPIMLNWEFIVAPDDSGITEGPTDWTPPNPGPQAP